MTADRLDHVSGDRSHWNDRYSTIGAESVSWYEPHPRLSLAMLERSGIVPPASVLDVGGGASSFARALVGRGFDDVTVLDLSDDALAIARQGLERPDDVELIAGDVTAWTPSRAWDLWHDRAVFHFLTEPSQREAYRRALSTALAPGGAVAIATFAPDGPEQCSGLPVIRYSPDDLLIELGDGFHEVASGRAIHTTPNGSTQPFSWVVATR